MKMKNQKHVRFCPSSIGTTVRILLPAILLTLSAELANALVKYFKSV